jgi:small subunit ribosomal protein S21
LSTKWNRLDGNLLLWSLDTQSSKEGEPLLAEVNIQEGESLESALRRFKRKVQQEEIIREIKRHSFYLKPGERKRVKAALARKRNRKKRSRDSESRSVDLKAI